jgi:hypothetical protein
LLRFWTIPLQDGDPLVLRSVEVYDIAAVEWSMVSVEMNVVQHRLAAAVHGDNLCAIGGYSADARHTMEVLALPPILPWTPTRHSTFPNSFKRTVYTLMHCCARTNALPDDVLFKIFWLLEHCLQATSFGVMKSSPTTSMRV